MPSLSGAFAKEYDDKSAKAWKLARAMNNLGMLKRPLLPGICDKDLFRLLENDSWTWTGVHWRFDGDMDD